MKLLLSPHNDDESLFAAYTLIREKPLVIIVTDSDLQEGMSAEQRREESRRASEVLGVAVAFLGLKDGALEQKEDDLRQRLEPFARLEWDLVYAPAIEGGHSDHDALGRVVCSLFRHVSYYSTYKDPATPPVGQHAVNPTENEITLKNSALDCYPSQLLLNAVHFNAVRGKPEYLNDSPDHYSV